MTKYIIHIGPHKTGSSYLQQTFESVRNDLLAEGVCYPDVWGATAAHAHFGLVHALGSGEDATAKLSADFARLYRAGYDYILLSAEDLSILAPEGIQRLRLVIGDAEADIVFYCRRWSEILPSAWREGVKQGSVALFPEFLAKALHGANNSALVNFGKKLAPYVEAFGADHLRLVSYNDLLDKKMDLFQHFCRTFLGWADPPKPSLGPVNVGMSAIETECVRIINAAQIAAGFHHRPYVFLEQMRAELQEPLEVLRTAMATAKQTIRLSDQTPALRGVHNALVRQFGAHMVSPRTDRLFRPVGREIDYIGQDYLMRPGVREAIEAINEPILAEAKVLFQLA